MANFVLRNQLQCYLLPLDLRDWVPADDLAHFVVEAVERVPMSAFEVNERGTGSAQYHPRTMLALLVYCYANGILAHDRSSVRRTGTSGFAMLRRTVIRTPRRSARSGAATSMW